MLLKLDNICLLFVMHARTSVKIWSISNALRKIFVQIIKVLKKKNCTSYFGFFLIFLPNQFIERQRTSSANELWDNIISQTRSIKGIQFDTCITIPWIYEPIILCKVHHLNGRSKSYEKFSISSYSTFTNSYY